MRIRRAVLVLVTVLLLCCSRERGGGDGGGEAGSIPASLDAAAIEAELDALKQQRTVRDIRNAGTAMMSWLTDAVVDGAELPPAEGTPLPPGSGADADEGGVRLADYQRIARADLAALLVPKYLSDLPERDAWEHPYEYYLTRDLSRRRVILIRSPGRDGVFETDAYTAGAFPAGSADADLVWADGYFVRWPQAESR